MNPIPTGEILPRDYGIVLRLKKDRLFISPSRYAIGQLILETPQEIRARLQEKAQNENISLEEVTKAFVAGVVKKERTKNILNFGRRRALLNVTPYTPATYHAQVKSKGNGAPAWYDVHVFNPSMDGGFDYEGVRCDCKDNFWDEVKNLDVMCVHGAALELALYHDHHSRISADENITGLKPQERLQNPSLPFNLRSVITDILFDYYVEGKSHGDINRRVLDNPAVFTPALESAFADHKATFYALRQRERETTSYTESDRRYHGAVKALEGRIEEEFEHRKFKRSGYGLEFKGTEHEVVAKRYRHGDTVYSLCIPAYAPPFFVKKHLGELVPDWISARDERDDHPFQRVGQKYMSVDDATRREGFTTVIIPGQRQDSEVFVPKILQERYEQAMKR